MADDLQLDVGSGGGKLLTDEITTGANSGSHAQREKIVFGPNGDFADVTSADGFPVAIVTQVPSLTVQGSIHIASMPSVTVAGSVEATQAGAPWTVTGSVEASQAGTWSVDAGTGFPAVYTEDAAGAGGETGIMILGRRQDADTSPVGADGDYHSLIFDDLGALKVAPETLIDSTNSRSASTLNGGTSWNASGSWVDIHKYALTTVLIYSTSAESGTLQIEFSMDGSTVHRTINYTVEATNNHPPHTVIPIAQYIRVSFDADGASPANDHANFTVQTIHHAAKSKGLTSRVTQAISDQTDVDNVRAVIVGETGGGSYVNVGVTGGGALKMDLEEIQGTAASVNSGTMDDGTQRVTLATDQPAISFIGSVEATQAGAPWTVTGSADVQGAVAHDAPDAGNPVKVGGRAHTTLPTAAANNDRVNATFTSQGGALVAGTDGTTPRNAAVNASGQFEVDIAAQQAGDLTVDINAQTLGNLTMVGSTAITPADSLQVMGPVAHGDAVGGNPLQIAGEVHTALPTAHADGDVSRPMLDDLGRLVVTEEAPEDLVTQNHIVLTDTTETTLIAAGGASVLRYITELTASNESGTKTRIEFRSESGQAVRFSMALAADGGGFAKEFKKPLQQATANEIWTAKLTTSVATVAVYASAVDQN